MFDTIKSKVKIGKVDFYQNHFDGRAYSLELKETENSIKGILKAKCDLTMLSLEIIEDREYSDSSLFFANGYQSWTTTRECDKNFKFPDLMPLGKFLGGFPEFCCGISGDYHFASYGETGKFHSYTYTYFRNKGDMNITLYGSKTERKGYTVFKTDMQNGKFIIQKDVEGLRLAKDEEYELFDIAVIRRIRRGV